MQKGFIVSDENSLTLYRKELEKERKESYLSRWLEEGNIDMFIFMENKFRSTFSLNQKNNIVSDYFNPENNPLPENLEVKDSEPKELFGNGLFTKKKNSKIYFDR